MLDLKRINKDVYFIAEIGQNHNGSLKTAMQMVDSLVGTGVSAIKTAKRCIDKNKKLWEAIPYDNEFSYGKNYYNHRRALELNDAEFMALKEYAEKAGFDFISSFTDIESLQYLVMIGVKILKIASQRMTDYQLINELKKYDLPIIASCGMCNMDGIKVIEKMLEGKELYFLQCTSEYPTKDENINLNVLKNDIFCGISGHWEGIIPDFAAYSMDARIIERHYTLDKNGKGRDHAASLSLYEIKNLMHHINTINKIKGSQEKEILLCEHEAITRLRADIREDNND